MIGLAVPLIVQHAAIVVVNAAIVALIGVFVNNRFQRMNGYVHDLEHRIEILEGERGE